MVKWRRRGYKRRYYKKRGGYRYKKRYYKRKYKKRFSKDMVSIRRQSNSSIVTVAANTYAIYRIVLRIQDLIDYGEFTELFNWYKFVGIKLEIEKNEAMGDQAVRAVTNTTTGVTVYDKRGSEWVHWIKQPAYEAAASSLDEMRQYANYKTRKLAMRAKIYDKYPYIVPIVNESTTTVAETSGKAKWLPMTQYAVPHYSYCYAIENRDVNTSMHYTVRWTAYLKLKGVS